MREVQRVDIRARDERTLVSILLRFLHLLKKKLAHLESDVFPDDAQDMMQLQATQKKLPFKAEEIELPKV